MQGIFSLLVLSFQVLSFQVLSCLMLLFIAGPVMASEASMKAIGMEAADKSGCYVTNGKSVAPTLSMMVAAYDDTGVKNDVVVKIIEVAIDAGCDVNLLSDHGLSPLHDAILFNKPELVSLLLSRGANPEQVITHSKQSLNGLNAFQFVDYLITKNQERSEIKSILSKYQGQGV